MDKGLNQFRRRLAQINGIKLDEARSQYATHNTMTKNSLGQLWHKHFELENDFSHYNSDKFKQDVAHYHGPEAAEDMIQHTNLLMAGPKYANKARKLRNKHNIPHDIF